MYPKRFLRGRLARAALTALALAAAPRPALSQGGLGFGVSLGANVPVADYGDAAKVGLVLNGFADLRLNERFNLRGELFWSRSDIDNPLVDRVGSIDLGTSLGDVTGNVDLLGGSADVVLAAGTVVQPYLIGGVGVFRRRVTQDVVGAVEEFRDLTRNETDVGYNGGVGLRFRLAGVTPFVEARYYSVATSPARTNFLPVTIGFTF